MILLGILALVLCTNSTNLITWSKTTVDKATNVSSSVCYMDTSVNIVTNLIAIAMRIYLPYFMMFTLNVIIIKRLRQSKRRVGLVVTNYIPNLTSIRGQRQGRLSNKEYKFTVGTMMMDLVFLVVQIPVGTWLTLSVVDFFTNMFRANPVANARFGLFANVAQLLAFSYSMAIIFMFIIFNKTFRYELIALFRLHRFFPSNAETTSSIRTN